MEIGTKRKPDEADSAAVVPGWLMSYAMVWVEAV